MESMILLKWNENLSKVGYLEPINNEQERQKSKLLS